MAKKSPVKQIAEAFGVAEVTVYRAISGDSKGAYKKTAERSEKIREMARELGFRVNASARATRRGWTGCIGMLVSPVPGGGVTHTPDLDRGIINQLAENGQYLAKGYLPDDPTGEYGLPELLNAWAADGLLINHNHDIPDRLIRLVDRHDVPTVWINSRHETNCVYPDDFEAGRQAAQYLVERGHRRILIARASVWPDAGEHYSQTDRLNGCRAAMADAGLTPMIFGAEDSRRVMTGRKGGLDQTQLGEHVLRQRGDATAIITTSTCGPIPVLIAALTMGLRIPDDLSVLGFVDSQQGPTPSNWEIHHTRLVVPFEEVGREAVKLINQRIESGNQNCASRIVPFGVQEGRTVRALPGQ